VAAFALGAEGVQMGTAFLPCEGSGATELHREAILTGKAGRTGLTRGFTGRLARGIHNRMMEEMNKPGVEVLPYPLQRGLMRSLAGPAHKAGRGDLVALWAGQSAGLARCEHADVFLRELVDGVSQRLGN
jgi:nitronate monooxygenase